MDHPRRDSWRSLDGPWAFALDPQRRWSSPSGLSCDAVIELPYAPESARSGVADSGFHRCCWYQRDEALGALRPQGRERLRLHFGAVDCRATVWVNGQQVGRHEGGHSPFTLDVTDAAQLQAEHLRITVRAEDDPADMQRPRGKQTWRDKLSARIGGTPFLLHGAGCLTGLDVAALPSVGPHPAPLRLATDGAGLLPGRTMPPLLVTPLPAGDLLLQLRVRLDVPDEADLAAPVQAGPVVLGDDPRAYRAVSTPLNGHSPGAA